MHAGKNVYCCFGCGGSGNVLAFWQAYRGKTLREAAAELDQIFETGN